MLSIGYVSAQSRIEPTIQLHYDVGVDSYKNNTYGFDVGLGYKATNLLSLGVGVGIGSCDISYYESTTYDSREDALIVPVFAFTKYSFIDGSISPFISLNVGYTISGTSSVDGLGLFINPAFGVDFPLSKGKLFGKIGYKMQNFKYQYFSTKLENSYDLKETKAASQIELAIGYSF